MIKYPSILPFPLLSSTSFKQQSNILRTEMNSGRARQRRRFLSVPTTMAATWRLKKSESIILEGFYENYLENNEWFLMNITTPKGLIEHEVRFINSPMENYKPLGAGKWSYQANVEIKKRVKVTEEEMVESSFSPSSFQNFINGFTKALRSYRD